MFKDELYNCGKLKIMKSDIQGYGVFATDYIEAEQVLEEVPFVLFSNYSKYTESSQVFLDQNDISSDRLKFEDLLCRNLGFQHPNKYFFKWIPKYSKLGEKEICYNVLPLGNGCIYNSSNYNSNAKWEITDHTFLFKSTKFIEPGEEIKTFYGYFVDENGDSHNCEQVFFLGLSEDCRIADIRGESAFVNQFSSDHYKKLNDLIKSKKCFPISIRGTGLGGVSHQDKLKRSCSHVYKMLKQYKFGNVSNVFLQLDAEGEIVDFRLK